MISGCARRPRALSSSSDNITKSLFPVTGLVAQPERNKTASVSAAANEIRRARLWYARHKRLIPGRSRPPDGESACKDVPCNGAASPGSLLSGPASIPELPETYGPRSGECRPEEYAQRRGHRDTDLRTGAFSPPCGP